jgi:hypothetical protein
MIGKGRKKKKKGQEGRNGITLDRSRGATLTPSSGRDCADWVANSDDWAGEVCADSVVERDCADWAGKDCTDWVET